MDTEVILRKFCLKLKMYKVECSSVYQCAMFQGYLKRHGIESDMRQGYCLVDSTSGCRHYWVETSDGQTLDILRCLSIMYNPLVERFKTILTDSLSQDVKRMDLMTDDKLVLENENQYDLFVKNPKQFWQDAPRIIKKFKN